MENVSNGVYYKIDNIVGAEHVLPLQEINIMIHINKPVITGICFLLFLNTSLFSGKDFLLINNSADSSGKGGTGTAYFGDISYSLINPANTVKNNIPQISFTYQILNNNLNYNYVGVGFPFINGLLSLHFIYLYLPNINEEFGGDTTDSYINYNDMAIILSDSFSIFPTFHAGLNIKYIKSEIADVKAETYAFDMGLLKEFNFFNFGKKYYNNLLLGFSTKNLGGKMKYIEQSEELPLTFTGGIKYSPYFNLALLYDMNKTKEKDIYHYVGAEFKTKYIIPRIGLKLEDETIIMAGLGLQYQTSYLKFKLDYAVNALSQVIKSHTISFNLEIHPVVENITKTIIKEKIVTEPVLVPIVITTNKKIRKIAVINFENTSDSEDLKYLSRTIPETVESFLSECPGVNIVNRKTIENRLKTLAVNSSDFKTENEMKLLGKLLNVDTLITGSYVSINERIRIHTRLVDITSGTIITSDQIQGDMDKDIFLLIDKTAANIRDKMKNLVATTNKM